ncbi:MAG TPA: AraC family transcriptional regulator, partial [Mycobacterium sp.]|nr:AraC family transcriptional regulator [Mycobacterium sp.]
CHGGGLVSCYLEPTSDRAGSSRRKFETAGPDVGIHHVSEEQLMFIPTDDQSARRWLDFAAPAVRPHIDPRIAAAAKQIRDDPATTISSRQLAVASGLSESRFLHLFRDELGTSLRRYRLWVRLVHAGTAIATGKSLTAAAAESGFASPSHLADRF